MQWLKRFGVGSISGRHIPGQRYRYDWYVGAHQAMELLERCLPYFVMKREQAELGIAFQRTKQHGLRHRGGVSDELMAKWQDMSSALTDMKQPVPAEVIQ